MITGYVYCSRILVEFIYSYDNHSQCERARSAQLCWRTHILHISYVWMCCVVRICVAALKLQLRFVYVRVADTCSQCLCTHVCSYIYSQSMLVVFTGLLNTSPHIYTHVVCLFIFAHVTWTVYTEVRIAYASLCKVQFAQGYSTFQFRLSDLHASFKTHCLQPLFTFMNVHEVYACVYVCVYTFGVHDRHRHYRLPFAGRSRRSPTMGAGVEWPWLSLQRRRSTNDAHIVITLQPRCWRYNDLWYGSLCPRIYAITRYDERVLACMDFAMWSCSCCSLP